jgi:diadenosine tetraphosphatase ApaH/serine/threonine PP2A family protein phosphatase
MQALILSDIHSNMEAFQAVLQDARARGGFDATWCLGDTVGYGPDPGPCIDLLRSLGPLAICGNHDLAALGRLGLEDFNPHAADAARWTAGQLSTEQRAYLEALPERLEQGDFTLVHGSPLDPIWEYFLPHAMSPSGLRRSFERFPTPYCLVGHSHIPLACREQDLAFSPLPEGLPVSLGGERLVLNPGGVGQPRDGDPRAAYALYDADASTFTHFRTSYAIEATQAKMRRAGLPEYLAARLSRGR